MYIYTLGEGGGRSQDKGHVVLTCQVESVHVVEMMACLFARAGNDLTTAELVLRQYLFVKSWLDF